jgi:DNA modification methylase
MYQGDCVSVASQLPEGCIDFSIYSPPFGSLFVYSDSALDMGNSSSDGEFAEHYAFMVREKFRITKPGRLTAVHCSDLPMTKWKDGAVGIRDFSGDIIRIHQEAGWIFHSRRTIWKCPVVEMTRTKHVGLLYKQLRSDSAKSRGGMPDYLMTFVKPGENGSAITHEATEFPVEQWQEWASPVWMDVNQTKVLNVKAARSEKDEKHLCPLQLDIIERALVLWSNPGDTVLSPFAGIGSEGYQALKANRKFIGIELKAEYWRQACDNLKGASAQIDAFTATA